MTTFIDAVNDVLARLRESSVTTVSSTAYSTLIGKFVNDAKRQVEDAWGWNALSVNIPLTLIPGTTTYVLPGSGLRHNSVTVNALQKNQLINVPLQWIMDQQQLTTVSRGDPCYYAWNGTDGTDSKVEIFPTPNSAVVLNFNMYVPQLALTSDATTITVPVEAIIAGAYARALVERGEDGGLSSSEGYGLYKGILADQIAMESSRFVENDCWSAA
jgi:hypothetical protein